jgi:hypothetical protein
MWESWATNASKGSVFTPMTRGPFPMYGGANAMTTTTSGHIILCARFPAGSCQLSLDSGMTWTVTTIDTSSSFMSGE